MKRIICKIELTEEENKSSKIKANKNVIVTTDKDGNCRFYFSHDNKITELYVKRIEEIEVVEMDSQVKLLLENKLVKLAKFTSDCDH